MKRLFIAVPLLGQIKEEISSLYSELNEIKELNISKKENLHFTLKYLGKVSDSELSEVREKLNQIKFKPFKVKLGTIGSFSIVDLIKVVWVGTESKEMIELINSVKEIFDYLRKEDHSQTIPHITLARANQKTDQEVLKKFLDKNENLNFGEMEVNKKAGIVIY